MTSKNLHIQTPLVHSIPLSRSLGKDIYFKMENLQPPGSFKIRGIGMLCQREAEKGTKHFISSSGGNAGIAVAYAGKQLKLPVTVFLPSTSNKIFLEALATLDAEIRIEGDVWDEAHQAALKHLEQSPNAAYIPPFDHPVLWEGHATMIDEVANAGVKPDAVVLAVGGGGLACGVLQGMHNHHWDDIPLFTVETEGAASFAKSVEAGKLITLEKIQTIATSLGAKRVCERLFQWTKEHTIIPLTVTDDRAMAACYTMANMHRLLVEASAGAALSVVFDKHPALQSYQSILVIVCGGIGISVEILNKYHP